MRIAALSEYSAILSTHVEKIIIDYQPVDDHIFQEPCSAGDSSQGFGLVVLDPPWENASATRGAKYASLPSRALLRLPLPELLHPVRSCRMESIAQ